MEDQELIDRIDRLAEQEQELHDRAQEDDGLDAGDQALLEQVRVERDQCWDLLRQRRALRATDQDPGEAEVRSAETVEHYLQ